MVFFSFGFPIRPQKEYQLTKRLTQVAFINVLLLSVQGGSLGITASHASLSFCRYPFWFLLRGTKRKPLPPFAGSNLSKHTPCPQNGQNAPGYDCWQPCLGAGACFDFCGQGNACCRKARQFRRPRTLRRRTPNNA